MILVFQTLHKLINQAKGEILIFRFTLLRQVFAKSFIVVKILHTHSCRKIQFEKLFGKILNKLLILAYQSQNPILVH